MPPMSEAGSLSEWKLWALDTPAHVTVSKNVVAANLILSFSFRPEPLTLQPPRVSESPPGPVRSQSGCRQPSRRHLARSASPFKEIRKPRGWVSLDESPPVSPFAPSADLGSRSDEERPCAGRAKQRLVAGKRQEVDVRAACTSMGTTPADWAASTRSESVAALGRSCRFPRWAEVYPTRYWRGSSRQVVFSVSPLAESRLGLPFPRHRRERASG